MWFLYIILGLMALAAVIIIAEKFQISRMTLEEKEVFLANLNQQQKIRKEKQDIAARAKKKSDEKNGTLSINLAHGSRNPALKCPHCDKRGRVHTKRLQRKVGISGGKATGAILTGGVSLLATGLSRKEKVTQAYCDFCKSKWTF